jgi:hypothetical protein
MSALRSGMTDDLLGSRFGLWRDLLLLKLLLTFKASLIYLRQDQT